MVDELRRKLPIGIQRAHSKVWWRWDNGLRVSGLRVSVPLKANVNADVNAASTQRHFTQLYASSFVATGSLHPTEHQ